MKSDKKEDSIGEVRISQQITKDMTFAQVMRIHPDVVKVFAKYKTSAASVAWAPGGEPRAGVLGPRAQC